jgi:integrase
MARQPTGQVVEDPRRPGVFGLRFRAYGKRRYQGLGKTSLGEAEAELRHLLADVERGIWRPPTPQPAAEAPREVPTFHEFASEWFEAHQGEWRPKTRVDYAWQLSNHLLPFFSHHRLPGITIREVDRYRAVKVAEARRRSDAIKEAAAESDPGRRERKLRQACDLPGIAPASINKTITRLGQILEVAVEYELLARNPARGKSRRVKASKPAPVWFDRAEQIRALLDAAGELDREAPYGRRHVARRGMLATFVFAGLRIGELTGLRWRDVDLASNRITVRESKTDAGVRTVDLLPVLRDELLAHKAQQVSKRSEAGRRALASELVFPTSNGQLFGASNIRRRVLEKAVERANERLAESDDVPLPDGLTPHKLRHSFGSLLVALGRDMRVVMDQMGHTDPAFTLRVYTHSMRSDEASRRALRELVGESDWTAPDSERFAANGADSGQPMGSQDGFQALHTSDRETHGRQEARR